MGFVPSVNFSDWTSLDSVYRIILIWTFVLYHRDDQFYLSTHPGFLYRSIYGHFFTYTFLTYFPSGHGVIQPSIPVFDLIQTL